MFTQTVSKLAALESAGRYATSRQQFQDTALRYIVEQTLNGNADAIGLVFQSAGMLLPNGNVTADGRAAYRWLAADPADGGCGLSFLQWNKESGKFRLSKGWSKKADVLDLGQIEHNISAILWYLWERNTTKADKAFDLSAGILRLVKQAKKEGLSNSDIESAFRDNVRAAIAATAVRAN